MAIQQEVAPNRIATVPGSVIVEPCERWNCWPVQWSGVWVGALASLCIVLLFGLAGIAVGAHVLGVENRVVDWGKVSLLALAFSVFGAFFAYAAGGWVAVKVAGILRSEPAMLHGAIVWLVTVPLLLALASLGAGSYFGSWHGGLSGRPGWSGPETLPFERPAALLPNASAEDVERYRAGLAQYERDVTQWREDTPRATRYAALASITALLLGLIGSVIGGWMASGEPMTFTYYRTRANGRTNGATAVNP